LGSREISTSNEALQQQELGEASTRLLSAEGASVVLGARCQDRIQSLAGELNGRGGMALAITTDITIASRSKDWST
jgi:NADP-dependent 3-hydroxy acid dehydrogenase YdfG